MLVILNIGLNGVPTSGVGYTNGVQNPDEVARLLAATHAVRDMHFRVLGIKLLQSDTEPTAVVALDVGRARVDAVHAKVYALAERLNQEAIAVLFRGAACDTGLLIGPKAAAWGEFAPARFLMPRGLKMDPCTA